jgi:hypothetical protein
MLRTMNQGVRGGSSTLYWRDDARQTVSGVDLQISQSEWIQFRGFAKRTLEASMPSVRLLSVPCSYPNHLLLTGERKPARSPLCFVAS